MTFTNQTINNTYMNYDKEICELLSIKAFSKIIGYAETGEPVELVYDLTSDSYELHVAGELVTIAPEHIIEKYK